jgi:hypothetical protein
VCDGDDEVVRQATICLLRKVWISRTPELRAGLKI